MEDKEIAENHAPNAQSRLREGNPLYTALEPRQEVSAGNQPKEVVLESQTEEVRGEERMVKEPLEVIKDATMLKGVMIKRDGTHSKKKGIGRTAQVIPKFFCC